MWNGEQMQPPSPSHKVTACCFLSHKACISLQNQYHKKWPVHENLTNSKLFFTPLSCVFFSWNLKMGKYKPVIASQTETKGKTTPYTEKFHSLLTNPPAVVSYPICAFVSILGTCDCSHWAAHSQASQNCTERIITNPPPDLYQRMFGFASKLLS